MTSYRHITSRCFVNVPFNDFDSYREIIIEHGLQPEIGLEGGVLDSHTIKDFQQAAQLLDENSLACTLHSPFFHLDPGSDDDATLQLTRKRLGQAFKLIPIFRPRSIVCHLNYREYGNRQDWFDTSLDTWRPLLEMAQHHQTPVMFENTYEKGPAMHRRLLAELDCPQARFCLDVGHVISFSRSTWQEWLPALNPWLGQLHLHDNRGRFDEHLAIGKGTFDFKGLFTYLKGVGLQPLITLEPHRKDDLFPSLDALSKLNISDFPAL